MVMSGAQKVQKGICIQRGGAELRRSLGSLVCVLPHDVRLIVLFFFGLEYRFSAK